MQAYADGHSVEALARALTHTKVFENPPPMATAPRGDGDAVRHCGETGVCEGRSNTWSDVNPLFVCSVSVPFLYLLTSRNTTQVGA